MEITYIAMYPVKGCAGISLPSATVTSEGLATPNGLIRDRCWMIVRESDGKFLTQRQCPRMATIKPSFDPSALLTTSDAAGHEDASMILNAPGMAPLRVPLQRNAHAKVLGVSCWDWTGSAFDEGTDAATWISECLQTPARLVRHAGYEERQSTYHRDVENTWGAPAGTEIAFADGYPFLLASEASLGDLNAHIKTAPVPMARFRPNIVVKGAPQPWEEDLWGEICVNGNGPEDWVVFQVTKPCDRCKVPTIDQNTGVEADDGEPSKTLHQLRSGKVLGWIGPPHLLPKSMTHAVFFGTNLCCVKGVGSTIGLGDCVEVKTRREGPAYPVKPAA